MASGDALTNDIVCAIFDTTGSVWNIASPLRSLAYFNRTQTFVNGQHYGQPTSIDLTNATNVPLASATGNLGLGNGGTGASLTGSAGGMPYSNSGSLGILAGTSTPGLPLLSGNAAAPSWATVTYPASATSGGVPYFSSAGVMASSAALTQGGLVYGGGAGAAPAASAAGTAKQIAVSGGTGSPTFVDFPDYALAIPAASCNGSTATALWSTIATLGFNPICYNSQFGVLQAVPSSGATAYFQFVLPSDWDTSSQPYLKIFYSSGGNSTGTVQWTVGEGCVYNDGAHTDAPGYTNETTGWSSQTMLAIHIGWVQSGQLTQLVSTHNCVAGATVNVRVILSGSAGNGVNLQSATVTIPRLLTFQAN